MKEFSRISPNAATITGAIVGFLCGTFAIGVGSMMGASYYGIAMMSNVYSAIGIVTPVYGIVSGALAGAVIAWIYNWALSLK